jgi:hypothetical protein
MKTRVSGWVKPGLWVLAAALCAGCAGLPGAARKPYTEGFVKTGNVFVRVKMIAEWPQQVHYEVTVLNSDLDVIYDAERRHYQVFFFLRTHKPVVAGCCGWIRGNPGLVNLRPGRALTSDRIPRFPFFSREPETIGFLLSFIGVSGSSQELVFVDTKTGTVRSVDAHVEWLDDGFPPSYAVVHRNFYIGPHALRLGGKPRHLAVHRFQDGEYRRDRAYENRVFREALDAVVIEQQDILAWQAPDFYDIPAESAERLLDLAFYAWRLGEFQIVRALLAELPDALRQELAPSLYSLESYE